MITTRLLCAAIVAVSTFASSPALAWFGPSAEDPYVLGNTSPESMDLSLATWTWIDLRVSPSVDNEQTRDGYRFGDSVFKPFPFEYIKTEFLRQVLLHEERDALREKLQGKTIKLAGFDAMVGLWIRLNETQNGKWETIRIRVVVDIDGTRYEASDTHPFRASEKPSPVSAPMKAMVESLVNQIHFF